MTKGFMKLSREILDFEEYFSERFTRMQAFIDLCFLASYKDRTTTIRGIKVDIKPCQVCESEESLAMRWKWSRNTVRKFLSDIEKVGYIEQQKSRVITLITIKIGLVSEQQNEQQNEQQIEQQIEQLLIKNNKENKDNNIEEKEKYKKEKDELFEQCWILYNRKGSKKKALEQWKKLNDDDRQLVMPHVKHYVGSRERQYQKDFERYLRDKTFGEVVIKGNQTIYDPERMTNDEYRPTCDGIFQYWDEKNRRLIFNGDINNLSDGYDSENRPDGAKVAWGMYEWIWSKEQRRWIK